MSRFPRKRFLKCLFTGLTVLALVMSLSGSRYTVIADDAVEKTAAPQTDSLEIPGSFKDLPEARDAVTAKRVAEDIAIIAKTAPVSVEPVIDADKVARPGAPVRVMIEVPKSNRASIDTYSETELVEFHATAYCLKGRTASGISVRPGMLAADPSVLPLGTVVHLRAGRYTGTYTVMDTGGLIKGRRLDVYVPTYKEAVEFGRQRVKIKVIGRNSAKPAGKGLLAAGL